MLLEVSGRVLLLAQSCLTLCDPVDCSPPGSSVHGVIPARILQWVALFLLQGNIPDPGIKPESPALTGRFFTTETPGTPQMRKLKPKRTNTETPTPVSTIAECLDVKDRETHENRKRKMTPITPTGRMTRLNS